MEEYERITVCIMLYTCDLQDGPGRLLVLAAALPVLLAKTTDGEWTCSPSSSFATYIQRVVEEEEFLVTRDITSSPIHATSRVRETSSVQTPGQIAPNPGLPTSSMKSINPSTCRRREVRNRLGNSRQLCTAICHGRKVQECGMGWLSWLFCGR